MRKVVLVSSCLFFLLLRYSFGQTAKDTLVNSYLEVAKTKIEAQKFTEANDIFKKIFALKAPMPDDLAYYYGFTLLNLKKYAQSRVALSKYLELQGEQGPLSLKAKEALLLADCKETGYYDDSIECDICFGDSTVDIACRNCKGRGIEVCALCKGTGVVTSGTNFATTYRTCQRCAGEKIIKCTVCKQTLKEKIICYSCNGKGRRKIKRKC